MTGDFFLTEWFFLGMRWIYENVVGNNIFLTVLLSTLILRLMMLYSDIKQRKSSAKMQELQPKIAKLQARYKDDKQKLQMEQNKLMKENGVGMLAGCLPMLLTLPLLLCFLAAFRFWGYEQNVRTLLEMENNITVAAETNSEIEVSKTFLNSKFLWVNNIWQPDNGFSPVFMDSNQFFGIANIKNLFYFQENPEAYLKYEEMFYLQETPDALEEYDRLMYANLLLADENEDGELTPAEYQTQLQAKLDEIDAEGMDAATLREKLNGQLEKDLAATNDKFDELTPTELQNEIDTMRQNALHALRLIKYDELTTPLHKQYEGYNNGMFILPILATLFQFMYAFYTQRKQAKAQPEGAANPAGNTGKLMLYLMPAMSFIFCLSATSTFAIYWTLSSVSMLGINMLLGIIYNKNKNQTNNTVS